jgi:hypothetical protein
MRKQRIYDIAHPEHVIRRLGLRYLSERRTPRSDFSRDTEQRNPIANEKHLGKGAHQKEVKCVV